jgi:hypothetical protein
MRIYGAVAISATHASDRTPSIELLLGDVLDAKIELDEGVTAGERRRSKLEHQPKLETDLD